jgi:hypothetical protein
VTVIPLTVHRETFDHGRRIEAKVSFVAASGIKSCFADMGEKVRVESQMVTARRIILAIIAVALTLPLVVIATFHIGRNQEGLMHQIGRFVLTLLLCALLFRGVNWARWVTGILFIALGVREFVVGVLLLSKDFNDGLVLIGTGSVCVASAYVLFFVPIVRAYFSSGPASAAKPV